MRGGAGPSSHPRQERRSGGGRGTWWWWSSTSDKYKCTYEKKLKHVLYVYYLHMHMGHTTLLQLRTVEPLYRGHQQGPAGSPVYSGTSL